MTKPLDGIRVLDLTRLLPGAIATLLLADMGAEVIKVEDPIAGDYARWMPPLVDGLGAFFRASNRDKQSIILNLKQEEGQQIFHKLVKSADVVIEGFRPGVTQRLRADYETLRQINPGIIYCSLSGWGQDGPYQPISGHDLNYIALYGLLGGMQAPQVLGGQVADVGGAFVGVMGITAALFRRERTGQGDAIDVSLAESALPFAFLEMVDSISSGRNTGQGALTGGSAYYYVYTSKDHLPMALGAVEPKFWANFCNAVGHPEWIELQHEEDQQERLKNDVSALFAEKSAQEWQALLADADCCFTLVTPPQRVPDDPQVQARGMMGMGADGLPWMRSPVRFRDAEFSPGTAPDYGEHTESVLRAAGYSEEELAAYTASGAIGRKEIR